LHGTTGKSHAPADRRQDGAARGSGESRPRCGAAGRPATRSRRGRAGSAAPPLPPTHGRRHRQPELDLDKAVIPPNDEGPEPQPRPAFRRV